LSPSSRRCERKRVSEIEIESASERQRARASERSGDRARERGMEGERKGERDAERRRRPARCCVCPEWLYTVIAQHRVSHHRSLGYGKPLCGFKTKHQIAESTAYGVRACGHGIPSETRIILLVDVTVQSHSGVAYMGLVPKDQSAPSEEVLGSTGRAFRTGVPRSCETDSPPRTTI
jgi:hypothetical protein